MYVVFNLLNEASTEFNIAALESPTLHIRTEELSFWRGVGTALVDVVF